MAAVLVVILILLLGGSSLALLTGSSSATPSPQPGAQDLSGSDPTNTLSSDAEIFGGSMGKLTAGDIAGYAAAAGFTGSDLAVAVAVALAESAGNPQALGDVNLAPTKGPSIGLWQIDMGSEEHFNDFPGWDLTDPQQNANAAFQIYSNAGFSFRPWSTFNGGQYRAHLADAQAAVNA